jgi:hypothetical protein
MVLVQRQSAQIALVAEVALWKMAVCQMWKTFTYQLQSNMNIKHACGKLQNCLQILMYCYIFV